MQSLGRFLDRFENSLFWSAILIGGATLLILIALFPIILWFAILGMGISIVAKILG